MAKDLKGMAMNELWELFPVILKEHNVHYSDWYKIEKHKLLECINNKEITRISHIGSTAVEGLISKPTVDILLEIDYESNLEQLIDTIKCNGWILMSYKKESYMQISFNKGYTNKGFAEKVYHLHMRYNNNWDELYFRDYLIEHKVVADEYGKLKMQLLNQYRHDRDGYTEAKSDFIEKYSKKAKEKYADRYVLK